MKHGLVILTTVALALFLPGFALGETVDVSISGTVIFNGIGPGPLGNVNVGDGATMTFSVDSNDFVEGVPGDTRGYVIDQASFSMSFDTPEDVGLQDPFPAGQTPYFTIVDGFPASDGFWVSTSPLSPGGVPLAQTPFQAAYRTGYVAATLDSLEILDALGTYGFDGLTVFSFDIWQGSPDNVVLGIDFESMTIELGAGDGGEPVPATGPWGTIALLVVLLVASAAALRRRAATWAP